MASIIRGHILGKSLIISFMCPYVLAEEVLYELRKEELISRIIYWFPGIHFNSRNTRNSTERSKSHAGHQNYEKVAEYTFLLFSDNRVEENRINYQNEWIGAGFKKWMWRIDPPPHTQKPPSPSPDGCKFLPESALPLEFKEEAWIQLKYSVSRWRWG